MAPTGKTSLWLKPETYERWKASGRSLAELVERGLDADDYEAILRRVLGELLSEDALRKIVSEEVVHALLLHAAATKGADRNSGARDAIRNLPSMR